jgi:hypothetical protein
MVLLLLPLLLLLHVLLLLLLLLLSVLLLSVLLFPLLLLLLPMPRHARASGPTHTCNKYVVVMLAGNNMQVSHAVHVDTFTAVGVIIDVVHTYQCASYVRNQC